VKKKSRALKSRALVFKIKSEEIPQLLKNVSEVKNGFEQGLKKLKMDGFKLSDFGLFVEINGKEVPFSFSRKLFVSDSAMFDCIIFMLPSIAEATAKEASRIVIPKGIFRRS